MTSKLAGRLGVQQPQIVHLPPDVVSLDAAQEASELADAYGVADGYPLDESQRFTLRAGLGERADGTWAAPTVADFKPRQGGGKTDTIAARELAGLILFGERLIIHTAHEFPTANESFLRMVAVFENHDDLRRRVARIRYANGEQGIELLSGQRLKYRARTGGSGRGFAKADLVVYDEAQHLLAEHVAASGPARLSNPNSQSWYAGSGGLATSKQAWALRKRALGGAAGRLAYVENTAEHVSLRPDGRVASNRPDPHDRDAWAQANPGLGRWVQEEALASLLDELGPELFARECLCVWDSEPAEPGDGGDAIDVDVWLSFADPSAERGRQPVFGVDVGADRLAHVAVAWRRPDGRVQVMLADTGLSPLRTPGRLTQLAADWKGPVMLGGPAASLEGDVRGAVVVSAAEFAAACGRFDDLLGDDQLRHGNQPELNEAVRAAEWRNVGTAGERAFQLRDAPSVGPLAAVVRALHGLLGGASRVVAAPMVETTASASSRIEHDVATMSF